ncbi:MAG: glutamate racemase [Clostridiales bacterium]|nr:glutamate racemase [Clostridiales bacterium]
MPKSSPIGFFDSGIGGLSVLQQVRKVLPHENYLYYGDSKNAPYGIREPQDILELTTKAAQHLLGLGIKALVIACNTATGVSLESLKSSLPIPVLGIQPALAAAQSLRKGGKILALATPATFKTERFKALMAQHGEEVIVLPAPGLMDFVEKGELTGDKLDAFLFGLFLPYAHTPVDVIVLGCTHYPFLKEAIAKYFPDAQQIDDSPRVAGELEDILQTKNLLNLQQVKGELKLMSSGGDEAVARMRSLYEAFDV